MVVCRFYLAGNCKYGDRCFNEHPRGNGSAGAGVGGGGRGVTFRDSFGSAGGQQTQNPYKWTAPGSGGAQTQQQQPASSISAQDIVKSLPKEMELWQTSRMWPFSCFSLEKELASLPEFVDMSPEELRWDAYTAIQQGTVDAYKQKVGQLAQEFRQKQDQIRAMPEALRQKLIQILEEGRRQRAARGSGQAVVRPSTFGGQTGGSNVFASGGTANSFGANTSASSSSFSFSTSTTSSGSAFGSMGSTQQPSSVFGQPSASAGGSVFGAGGSQSPSVFGQATGSTGSVFGSSNNNNATGSVFGKPAQPASGLFGSTPSSGGGSVFGGGGAFAQPGGSAGSSGVVPAPGLFGKGAVGAGSVFGQTSSTGSVFGQASGSVFGQNTGGGGGLFGKPASSSSSTSVFGQSASSGSVPAPGLFGASPSAQGSVFGASGGATGAQPGLFGVGASTTGGSVFGGGAAASASPQSGGVGDSGTLYTPLADLTAEERAQFEAKMFTAGMIPMRPPPKELINAG